MKREIRIPATSQSGNVGIDVTTQLPVINEANSPSPTKVEQAKAVLRRFEQHGRSVYAVQGSQADDRMVQETLAAFEQALGRTVNRSTQDLGA